MADDLINPQEKRPSLIPDAEAISGALQVADDAIVAQQRATTAYGDKLRASNVRMANDLELLTRRSDEAYTKFDEAYKNLEDASSVPNGVAKIMSYLGNDKYNKQKQLVRVQAAGAELDNVTKKIDIAKQRNALERESAGIELNIAGENTKSALARIENVRQGIGLAGDLINLDTTKMNNRITKINTDIAEAKMLSPAMLDAELKKGDASKFSAGILYHEKKNRDTAQAQLTKATMDAQLARLNFNEKALEINNKKAIDALSSSPALLEAALRASNETGKIYIGTPKEPDAQGNYKAVVLPKPDDRYNIQFEFTNNELASAIPIAQKNQKTIAQEIIRQDGVIENYKTAVAANQPTLEGLTNPGFVANGAYSPELVAFNAKAAQLETALTGVIDAVEKGVNPSTQEAMLAQQIEETNAAREAAVKAALTQFPKEQQEGVKDYLTNGGRISNPGAAEQLLKVAPGNSANLFNNAMQILQTKATSLTSEGGLTLAVDKSTKQGTTFTQTSKVNREIALTNALADPQIRTQMDAAITSEMTGAYIEGIISRMALDHPAMLYIVNIVDKDSKNNPIVTLKQQVPGPDGSMIKIINDQGQLDQAALIKAMAVAESQQASRIEAYSVSGQGLPNMGKNNVVDTFIGNFRSRDFADGFFKQYLRQMNPQDAALYNVITQNRGEQKVIIQGGNFDRHAVTARAQVEAGRQTAQGEIERETQEIKGLENVVGKTKPGFIARQLQEGLNVSDKDIKKTVEEKQGRIRNLMEFLSGPTQR